MTKSYTDKGVFVDSSAFKAVVDRDDGFYKKAAQYWKSLAKSESEIVTTNYILDETFTLLRVKCRLETALNFRDSLEKSSPVIKIVRVTVSDEKNAWKWFEKDWSRLSYTDCVSFAVMERLGVKEYFGFDEHFSRAGFKSVV